MSEILQQAVLAIKTGDLQRADQLPSRVLWADPQTPSFLLQGADSQMIMFFKPDGKWLATGNVVDTNAPGNGPIRLGRMHPADLIKQACQLAGWNFTQAEWQQFMGDLPYQRTCLDLPAGEPLIQPVHNGK